MNAPDAVVRYYDTHPINEEQILHALQARGVALEGLSEDVLKEHDQDHFGGLDANDILLSQAGFTRGHRVLDVCSGMGGPARYLAHKVGCQVVGLDLTESRVQSAQRLTRLVNLQHLVEFHQGTALQMPFPDGGFDGVMGQEAWCHVPNKSQLIAECVRVLKRGGVVAFTDILRTDRLSETEAQRLQIEMTFNELGSHDQYRQLLEQSGFTLVSSEDLGRLWTEILVKRLAMYRSLQETTARKFGQQRHQEWDRYYSFFVGLYGEGKLTGGRFVARKD